MLRFFPFRFSASQFKFSTSWSSFDDADVRRGGNGVITTDKPNSGGSFRRRAPFKQRRSREQFRQHLEAESGFDEAERKFGGEAPIDQRVATEFVEQRVARQRRTIAVEMARRKYYNYPVEDNLLTWTAKEQIFQLRDADEATWTPDRIAESFPISVEAARRLLRTKWPPLLTGEDVDDAIRRHDEEVRRRWILLKKGKTEDGLLSIATLNMVRSGQVKFLPMYAAGNSKLSNDKVEKKTEFSSTIMPKDGPFVKLYKTHLQYLERTSSVASSTDSSARPLSVDKIRQELSNTEDGSKLEVGAQLLRKYVFPEDSPEMENAKIPYEQFRIQLKASLRRRNRPEDQKYLAWMSETDKTDSASGTPSDKKIEVK